MDIDSNEHITEERFRERYGYIPLQKKTFTETLRKRSQCNALCISNFIKGILPIVTWLPNYPFSKYALGDAFSGLTISVVRIPQGLAYGLLAGLCPINGLYTGFFSPLVYAVFGTSRHLSVGVFSIISLMLGSALDQIQFNPDDYFVSSVSMTTSVTQTVTAPSSTHSVYATTNALEEDTTKNNGYTDEQNLAIIGSLTVLIGVVLICLGICHLGMVTVFLSDPLVSGFTTAAAIYVVTAQMKHITGISLNKRSGMFGLIMTWVELFSHIAEIQWAAVVISVICLSILIPIKYVNRTYKKQLRNIPIPVELFIVILGTVISSVANLKKNFAVRVVGTVPSGMPTPVLPMISLWPMLIKDAISIAIVIFAISVSLGKMFGKKHGYQIVPNQELIAIGLAQITNGLFKGHAGGGALARSTVQESSGGNTQLAGVVSSCIVLLVLLVIGPLFEPLPIACLSCIILSNLHGLLMQFDKLPGLWKLDVFDFSIWLVTFTAVIVLGLDLGLGVGIIFSVCLGALRTNRTHSKVLGKIPSTGQYRDIKRFSSAVEFPRIKIVQFPESPTYVNKSSLQKIASDLQAENEILKDLKPIDESHDMDEVTTVNTSEVMLSKSIKFVIFDCSSWNCIDTVALSTFKQVVEDLNNIDISVLLASVPEEIYHKLFIVSILGNEMNVKAYPDISNAVQSAIFMLNEQTETLETILN